MELQIHERRRYWVRKLAREMGRDVLAKKLGYEDTNYVNQIFGGHSKLGNKNSVSWSTRLGLPDNYFDRPVPGEDDAVGVSDVSPGPYVRGLVPLISWVQAGDWSEAMDPLVPGEAEDLLPCAASHSQQTYALRVNGDSMTSATGKSYPHGSIIFVDPEQRGGVQPGDRVIAKLNGHDEVTFKQLAEDRQGQYLKPLNPNHEAIYGEFRVLGKVIGKWEPE